MAKTRGSNEAPTGNWGPIRLVSPAELPAWDSSLGLLHVVVDTPKGSPIKFKYDTEKRAYTISHVLPPGTVFPFDFGSIPQTLAEDGDPLDVFILIEEPTFAGCLVSVRLVGVLEAEQTQEGKTNRNDRLIGAAEASRIYRDIRSLGSVPAHLLNEIEHFFVSYKMTRPTAVTTNSIHLTSRRYYHNPPPLMWKARGNFRHRIDLCQGSAIAR